jgi:hypothetical protein
MGHTESKIVQNSDGLKLLRGKKIWEGITKDYSSRLPLE